MKYAQRIARIKPSPTLAVNARAIALKAEGKDIISLGVGEPDFDTPEHIKHAAILALEQGKTKYTLSEGTVELRQAIAKKLMQDNQLDYNPKQILVSSGAKFSVYVVMQALLNPGDEVIIPAPYWVSYPDMVLLSEATPVFIHTTSETRLKITPEQLNKAITPKTKLLILNSPSNPSGVAYTKAELAALGKVLLQHPHVMVLTDDIYEKIYWGSEPFSNILNATPELYPRTIVINGVSKSYAMTGWRIGFAAVADQALLEGMKNIQSQSTSNPCSISQAAAVAAYLGDQSCVAKMNKVFHERHDLALAKCRAMPGVKCLEADGAFYLFPDFNEVLRSKPNLKDDVALAEFLLERAQVALVPGSAFGTPGFLRISYALGTDNLIKALDRIAEAIV